MNEILLLSMKIGNSDIINSLQPLKNNCYNCAVVVLLCRQKAAKLTERRRDCYGGIGGGRNWRKKAESKEKEEKVRKLDTYKVILCKSCCGIFTQSFLPFLIICMLLKIVLQNYKSFVNCRLPNRPQPAQIKYYVS